MEAKNSVCAWCTRFRPTLIHSDHDKLTLRCDHCGLSVTVRTGKVSAVTTQWNLMQRALRIGLEKIAEQDDRRRKAREVRNG